MRKRFTIAVSAVATLFLCLGTLGLVANAAPAPTPPPGLYADGSIVACVSTTVPRTFKAHVGTKTKPCPTGYALLSWAQAGKTGAKGLQGPSGEQGIPGPAGDDAPAPVYATMLVDISRGHNAAGEQNDSEVWATISTAVGSPDGDTASSTFRASCSEAQAPCVISVRARATSDHVALYPRLLIQRSTLDGVPAGMCEYGDGTDNDGGTLDLTGSAEPVPLGIGGSLDCGAGQVRPSTGVVESISVPAGRYDIAATAVFTSTMAPN